MEGKNKNTALHVSMVLIPLVLGIAVSKYMFSKNENHTKGKGITNEEIYFRLNSLDSDLKRAVKEIEIVKSKLDTMEHPISSSNAVKHIHKKDSIK